MLLVVRSEPLALDVPPAEGAVIEVFLPIDVPFCLIRQFCMRDFSPLDTVGEESAAQGWPFAYSSMRSLLGNCHLSALQHKPLMQNWSYVPPPQPQSSGMVSGYATQGSGIMMNGPRRKKSGFFFISHSSTFFASPVGSPMTSSVCFANWPA